MTKRRGAAGSAPADDQSALFGAPGRRRGATERAMERTITEWRGVGKVIDPIMSRTLRSQALAVDVAEARRDPWQISNANRVLMELLTGYGIRAQHRPIDDPFETFLREMGTDDLDADAAPLGSAAPVLPAG